MAQTVSSSRLGRKAGVFLATSALTAALGLGGVGPAIADAPIDTTAGGAQVHFNDDDHSLATGETFTSPITVTTTAVPPKVDLVFLVDVTSSMRDQIGWLQAEIAGVVAAYIAQGAAADDFQIGIALYTDLEGGGYVPGAFSFAMPLGANTPADAAAVLAAVTPAGGGDYPEATVLGLLSVIDQAVWRADALHHIMVVTDAAAKINPGSYIGGYEVTAPGLAAAAFDSNVTISIDLARSDGGLGTGPLALTEQDLAAQVNAIHPGLVTVDESSNQAALAQHLTYVASAGAPYTIIPSATCRYASDGTASSDVVATLSPTTQNVVGANVTTFTLTATTVEPPGRVGDRRTVGGAANAEATVCTIDMTVNGDTAAETELVRWAPYRALPPVEDVAPEHLFVNLGDPATLHLTAHGVDPGTVTYQWYSNTVASTTGGSLIPGATGLTYSPSTSVVGTTYYYVTMLNTLTGAYYPTASALSSVGSITIADYPRLVAEKSVSPRDGIAVLPGGFLDYTLTFSVEGGEVMEFQMWDRLEEVLDDAVLVSGPTSSSPSVTVGELDSRDAFEISGTVTLGAPVTVTYRVQVKTDNVGDNTVDNVLYCMPQNTPPGEPEPEACYGEWTVNPVARIALEHTIVPRPGSASPLLAGNVVDLIYHVTNIGGITLADVAISEDSFTGSGTLGQITCPTTPLAPGESFDCQAVYTLTAADAAAGRIDSKAHATGYTPSGDLVAALRSVMSNTDDAGIVARAVTGPLPFTGAQVSGQTLIWPGALVLGGVGLIAFGLVLRRRKGRTH